MPAHGAAAAAITRSALWSSERGAGSARRRCPEILAEISVRPTATCEPHVAAADVAQQRARGMLLLRRLAANRHC